MIFCRSKKSHLNVCQALNIKRSINTNSIDTDESSIAENLSKFTVEIEFFFKCRCVLCQNLKTFTIKVTCTRGESIIDCVDEQNPGDKVIIKCKTGYKPVHDVHETERVLLKKH